MVADIRELLRLAEEAEPSPYVVADPNEWARLLRDNGLTYEQSGVLLKVSGSTVQRLLRGRSRASTAMQSPWARKVFTVLHEQAEGGCLSKRSATASTTAGEEAQ